ncbi:hypothetical protein D3C71_1242630 [compost metagenome]
MRFRVGMVFWLGLSVVLGVDTRIFQYTVSAAPDRVGASATGSCQLIWSTEDSLRMLTQAVLSMTSVRFRPPPAVAQSLVLTRSAGCAASAGLTPSWPSAVMPVQARLDRFNWPEIAVARVWNDNGRLPPRAIEPVPVVLQVTWVVKAAEMPFGGVTLRWTVHSQPGVTFASPFTP